MKTEIEQNMKEKKPSKRKYIIAAVCVVLLVGVALAAAIFRWNQKIDHASERAIREAAAVMYNNDETNLSKKDPNELTEADFKSLTEFVFPATPDGHFAALSDIKLLEKFTSLESLSISGTRYPDSAIPKWMKYFAKLGVFDLEEKFSIDLSPIQNLTALKSLRLSNSQISDITPLKNLVNLEQLFIDFTNVTGLEPLRELKNLQVLSINETKVSSLEPIMRLEKLRRLLVIECPNITDEQLKELKAAHPDMVIIKDYLE